MDFKNNHDFVTLFEKRLSEFTGAPYVVTTNSATSAVMLSMKCLEKFGEVQGVIEIPSQTYLSIPQTLRHLGYRVVFRDEGWTGRYQLKGTNIFDCAVGFRENMYQKGTIHCLSFQQKKCLNIGQGGAILLDNKDQYEYLKRISWDGRDASMPVKHDMDNLVLDSFHMYLSPDNCAKGVLLLNQINDDDIIRKLGSYSDYPDISELGW